jgi:alanyl aminopeptidase
MIVLTRSALLLCPLFLLPVFAAETKPELRLPDSVAPTSYALELTLNPAKDDFTGIISIHLDVRQPVRTIWLNAAGISVAEASLKRAGKTITAHAAPSGEDFLGIEFASEIPKGAAELTIRYRAKLHQEDASGAFGREDNGNKYIYTQFESTDARGAFPCFDEPSYKVPWQLTLHVPASDTAVSNTPVASESKDSSGKTYVFEKTKPLPSYLVAFAVGPFEFVDAGKAGKNRFPVRIVVPKGHVSEAKYAAEITAEILTRLEEYFGIPFPYEKSDQVAVPITSGFGAMENPGMVTYGQTTILSDPARDTTDRQRDYASTAAHELAHQWFGDLVTTAWWNDIWLNEAFATWMEQKLLAEWKPEWETRVDDLAAKSFAEQQDSLVSARKIRQEIKRKEDINGAFDAITYEKGAAVIGMFERYLGTAEFRKGVQRYLKQYAFRNATAAEFLDAIGSSSGKNITKAFSTFLDQGGVPVVSASLDCGQDSPVLHLEQQRSLPLGAPSTGQQTWNIPVCVRSQSAAGGVENSCLLMDQPKQDMKLSAKGCPAWVQMNADASGYYQVDYRGDLLQKLTSHGVEQRLNPAERVDLLANAVSMSAGGRLPVARELELVDVFHGDSNRFVVEAALSNAAQRTGHGFYASPWVPTSLQPNYQRFIQSNFGARAHEIGWLPRSGEPEVISLLRPQLLHHVAIYGADWQLAQQARGLADKWLEDHSAVDPNLVGSVLRTASYYGDKGLMDRYLAAFKKTGDRQARREIQRAMRDFRDPAAINAAMCAVLSGDIPLMEGGRFLIVFAGQSSDATRKMPLEFVKAHYDELLKNNTGGIFGFGGLVPLVGVSFCDSESRDELKNFFEPRVAQLPGGRLSLSKTLEGIDVCIATNAAQLPSLEAFLRKY